MALAAIIALIHDLIITAGIYSLVGFEVSPSTVIALLTILGYSLYDTVVVFDKVRENIAGITGGSRMTLSQAANLAVNQTLVRSINTSIIALLPVAGLLIIGAGLLGAGSLKDLALALLIGLASGAYSSIFIATPLRRGHEGARAGVPPAGPARRRTAVRRTAAPAVATAGSAGEQAAAAPRTHRGARGRRRRARAPAAQAHGRARSRASVAVDDRVAVAASRASAGDPRPADAAADPHP